MKKAALFLLIAIISLSLSGCAGRSDAISSAADLSGRNIGVLSGSIAERVCRDIENAAIFTYPSSAEASEALKNGEIDAIVTDRTVARKIVNAATGLKMLSDPAFKRDNYVIAVKKGDYDLLGLINVVLAEATSDGRLSDIVDGYMGKTPDQRRDFYAAQTQLFNSGDQSGGTLKAGIGGNLAPLIYTDGGEYMGIDIEIARLIAKKVSKQLSFAVYDDSELIPALRRGEVDFIISALTEDSRYVAQLDYSDSYFSTVQSIIVTR